MPISAKQQRLIDLLVAGMPMKDAERLAGYGPLPAIYRDLYQAIANARREALWLNPS